MLPQSRKITVRSARSAGGSWKTSSSGRKRYSTGSGNSFAARNITESLPSASSISMHRQQRAERVAVGVLVGGEQEALPCADLVGARSSSVLTSSGRLGHLGRAGERCGRRARRSRRSGRSASASASSAARAAIAPGGTRGTSAARRGSSSRSASPPSTLTYTRAVRRSGLVSTAVTVTNPIRGSFSSVAMASPRTSRITSLTRRIRAVAIAVPTITARGAAPGDPLRHADTQFRRSSRLSRSRSKAHPSGQRLSMNRTSSSARSPTCPSPTSAQSRVDRCHLS